MPHLSKKNLKSEVARDIYNQLLEIVGISGNFNKRKLLLDSLLTDTEKLMLAKRLAIIFLLAKEVAPYRIWKKLNVSPSTVARVELKLNTKYKNLLERARKENRSQFEKILEGFLSISMPPRVGPRWKWLDEVFD